MKSVAGPNGRPVPRVAPASGIRAAWEAARPLLDALPDGAAFAVGADGRVVGWSEAAVRISGYVPSDVLGRQVSKLIGRTPEGKPERSKPGPRVAGPDSWPADVRLLRKDGVHVRVGLTVRPVPATGGAATQGYLFLLYEGKDPATVVEYRAMLASIVESSDDAILSKDRRGIILTWNAAAERLFGYSAREIIGASVDRLIPRERLREERSALDRVWRGERVEHYVSVRRRKDGTPVDVSISVSPIRDAAGRIVGASKVARDVGRERRAEAALQDSDRRMRAIVEAAVDAIITIDPRGAVRDVNPAAERMFGYPAREMIGRNVNMLMPEPFRSEHDAYLRNYLRTGTARVIGIGREVAARHKDGTVFPVTLSVSEIRTDSGRLFIGMLHDLTSRRRLEREIVEAAAHEQRRIGRDLHDGLCQDLVGLAFQADATARQIEAVAPEQAEAVRRLAASARESATQARRLAHGLNPVDLRAGGLAAALHSLAVKVSQAFGVACRFRWDGHAEAPDDVGANHLFRIVQEAVGNAVSHGKATRIAVTMKGVAGRVTVAVRDNGVGLPPSALRPTHEGLPAGGIGLHTMRYRANLMGGTFQIGPGRSGGTVVTCSVPRPTSPEAGAPPTGSSRNTVRRKSPSGPARRPDDQPF